jgi:hypothetical protein
MSLFRQHRDSGLFRLRLLKTKRVCVYIHKITTVDPPATYPHNHGCDFISVGLGGWYSEALFDDPTVTPQQAREVRRKRWNVHRMRNTQAHRIVGISGPAVYTLFVAYRLTEEPAHAFDPEGNLVSLREMYIQIFGPK